MGLLNLDIDFRIYFQKDNMVNICHQGHTKGTMLLGSIGGLLCMKK